MPSLLKRSAKRVQQDLSAFEALVEEYQRPMYRVAYRLAGNHDDAMDLIGEALYEAFRNFGRFEPGTRFDRWLYRIMTNRHIDHVRRTARRPVLSLDQVAEESVGGWELPDPESDPSDLVMDDLLSEHMQTALDELPEEFRMAVILADLEEMTYDEVAQILHCPVGTVRSRLHRGRMLLRQKLTVAAGSGGR
ncbi:MAG: sigma-70 family RNA polymerase sigma factor [Armatimonadetes bacterium]|nr:sigma-70 family RNA polymerase sigma factor [Armatimonadota bacterium]